MSNRTVRADATAHRHDAQPAGLRRLGRGPWLAAAAAVVVLLALADRYGFHRDELYFRVLGDHPAFGYADQPPFTPLMAGLQSRLFGAAPWALRVWPALTAGAVVILAAMLCAEFGGGRRAQAFAAIATATSPGVLLAGHLLSTASTDLLVWEVVLLLSVRALRRREHRWWLAVGIAVGVGLQNKDLPAILAVAIAAGAVLDRRRDVLLDPWWWSGASVAVALAAPNVIWQADHGFPQWDVAQAQRHGTGVAAFVVLQLLLFNPVLLPSMIRGARLLWQDPQCRMLAWSAALIEVFFLVTGGKPYYPAAIPLLLAVRGVAAIPEHRPVPVEDRETGLRRRDLIARWATRRAGRIRYSLAGLFAVALAPAVLPVLTVAAFASSPYLGSDNTRAQIGWPQLATQVDAVVAQLPYPRVRSVVLTESYGEAGAVLRYGTAGLRVASGHNSLWTYTRPAADVRSEVVVGYDLAQLRGWFLDCREVGSVVAPFGVDNEATGAPIAVCGSPRTPWRDLWPRLRHDN